MGTKKWILLGSGSLTVILLLVNWIGTFKLCGANEYGSCMDTLASTMITFFPIIPLFIFSLITYKMRKEVFNTWRIFAAVGAPLSMLAILIAPEYGNSFIPVEKGTVALFSSLLFSIISLGIILWKYFAKPTK